MDYIDNINEHLANRIVSRNKPEIVAFCVKNEIGYDDFDEFAEQFDVAEEIISWFPDYQATCLSNNDLLDSVAIKTIIANIVYPAVISFVGYKIFKNKEIK